MKRKLLLIPVILLCLLAGCMKKAQTTSDALEPPVKPPPITPVIQPPINLLPTHILTSATVTFSVPYSVAEFGTTALRLTYDNNTCVIYNMDSKVTLGKSLVTIVKDGVKYYAYSVITKSLKSGISTVVISSTTGLVYYSWQYNNLGGIGNEVVFNTPPWFVPVGLETFGQCMQRHFTKCMGNWQCGFACGLSLGPCGLGMGIACSGRLACPSCY